jgi:hypothetical protein
MNPAIVARLLHPVLIWGRANERISFHIPSAPLAPHAPQASAAHSRMVENPDELYSGHPAFASRDLVEISSRDTQFLSTSSM